MDLRESQIEAAAMALYAMFEPQGPPWESLPPNHREWYMRAVRESAPFLEYCWDLPNGPEMAEIESVVDNAENLGSPRSTAVEVALASFILRRNREILARIGVRA